MKELFIKKVFNGVTCSGESLNNEEEDIPNKKSEQYASHEKHEKQLIYDES